MGISLGKSSSGRASNYGTPAYAPAPVDPRPDKFIINWVEERYPFCLAEIIYPNCTTFEGKKLILFKDVTPKWIKSQKLLDPHFIKDGKIIARFKPTQEGLTLARLILYPLK